MWIYALQNTKKRIHAPQLEDTSEYEKATRVTIYMPRAPMGTASKHKNWIKHVLEEQDESVKEDLRRTCCSDTKCHWFANVVSVLAKQPRNSPDLVWDGRRDDLAGRRQKVLVGAIPDSTTREWGLGYVHRLWWNCLVGITTFGKSNPSTTDIIVERKLQCKVT